LNRRVTTGIFIAVAGLVIAVLGVIAIRQIVSQALAPPPVPTPQARAAEAVVVVTHDMVIGDILQADDLTTVDIPVELIPRNALKDELEVIGRITKVALVDGEMVLRHHLADPTNVSHDLAFVLDDDQVLLAFPANDLMSGLNIIQRGDLVDIFISLEKAAPLLDAEEAESEEEILIEERQEAPRVSRLFTFDAMQALEMTAIIAEIQYEENQTLGPLGAEESSETTRQPSSVRVRAYLLALSPQDALVLKHLKDIGANIDFVLRSAAPPIYFDLDPVFDEYIVEKYQLEVIE
jgi:Flp pilus assembly protein CpaB